MFDPKGGLTEVAVPAGEVILTEARAKRLVTAVQQFIPLFPSGTPLDVEWVLEGETIWIVELRADDHGLAGGGEERFVAHIENGPR